jgi:hypothetical protein
MPQIDFTRDEVKRQLSKWRKIRDCLSGQEKIKEAGTVYLPMPNAHDKSEENKERYAGYKLRAMFLNAVANTVEGLLGQVFSTDPVVELPESMRLLQEDCDGEGVTLTQRAKRVLADTLALGRACLLVDFPKALRNEDGLERDFSRAEMQDGTARANILQFDPENVINWRTMLVGGKRVLSLVVIAMKYISYDDGFEIKEDNEWRVLKLENGVYVCEVWRVTSQVTQPGSMQQPSNQFMLHDRYVPRDSTGAPLRIIPFTFVGSLNNNDSPDKPPMYDIAEVNIAHYRNSADYEDNVYMLGQGTPVATGLTGSWIKEQWGDKPMQLGSRGIVPLPVNGDFKIVGSPENGMVMEAMAHKERQLAMLGAKLVEKQEVQRTLGEAQMERAQVESTLVQCAKNTAQALQKCLRWAAAFYGEDTTQSEQNTAITFELSTDFAINKLTPEERKSLIAEYQGGLLTFEEARNGLRQSGIAYLDDKKARADIDAEAQTRVDMAAAEAAALHDATGGDEPPVEE